MKYGMATTVTLVFADECHREAWVKNNIIKDSERPTAVMADYDRRKTNQNLIYTVGPIKSEKFTPTRFDDFFQTAAKMTDLRKISYYLCRAMDAAEPEEYEECKEEVKKFIENHSLGDDISLGEITGDDYSLDGMGLCD